MSGPLLQPLRAIRPSPGRAADVIARPYDVLSVEEAKVEAAGRPWSFLHLSRAEIDLPADVDPHAPEVYEAARAALARMLDAGVLIRDPEPCYYAYRIDAQGRSQMGVAAAASVAAYDAGRIRRHEHTRPDKELDRTRQIDAVAAHTGLVLTAHRPDATVAATLARAAEGEPVADASTVDGARHRVWRIAEPAAIAAITGAFEAAAAIYIADGHHRSAAASRIAAAGRHPGAGRFLVVSFPTDEMRILDYNRVVRDLRLAPDAFLAALERVCEIEDATAPVAPREPATFGMFLGGDWRRLRLRRPPGPDASPVERLDVSLLQERILAPLLGIGDPRSDPRIDFIGGGRGLAALEQRVRSGQWAVAFSMRPTGLADLIAVADAGLVMPPKSTWFEPKLADGLLSLPID